MVLPKPLMPVRSEPVLNLLLKWLRRNDIQEVYITTGYLGHLIKSVCGDGQQWGMDIRYTEEPHPLGTIGPLSLLREQLDQTFLVINGDVLTDLNISDFHSHHRSRDVCVTVGSSVRKIRTEFGVIKAENGRIVGFKEKPVLSNLVSMGIYCMEPEVFRFIPNGVPFGFDDLILCLLNRKIRVETYVHEGRWLDIGRIDDFQTAQDLVWDVERPAFERENAA
jgi:NDP-sugar pyrophosphorylase family protein